MDITSNELAQQFITLFGANIVEFKGTVKI